MDSMNGFRRSAVFGGSGFGSRSFLGGVSLAQAAQAPTDWLERGRTAVASWDALVDRVANIKDDGERGRLLEWMGRSDTPGSNTERYGAVLQDAKAGKAADPALAERRVAQLEGAVGELTSLVENAEKAYGTINKVAPMAAAPIDRKTIVTGILAVTLLVAVPLMIKD